MMKTEAEIHRAHDRLIAIITGAVPSPFEMTDEVKAVLMANCDVLCWVLGHDHNDTFSKNLHAIADFFRTIGVREFDLRVPVGGSSKLQ